VGLLKSNLITLAGGVSAPTVDPTLALDLEFSSMSALPASVTFTRASVATYFDQNGALQTALANVARFDHDPVTLEPLGLLIEAATTNSLLNSAAPGTQGVTVTAAPWTLSFYGTGSVALSGAYVGTLVGTGPFPARASLTFTPTAGTLTLTVTGSVTLAQLELGSAATSYIATTSATATRTGDRAVISGANFTPWYNAPAGTFVVAYMGRNGAPVGRVATFSLAGSGSNTWSGQRSTTGAVLGVVRVVGTNFDCAAANTSPAATADKYALAVEAGRDGSCLNGGTVTTNAPTSAPNVDQVDLGSNVVSSQLTGWLASFKYYNVAKSNAELIDLTTP